MLRVYLLLFLLLSAILKSQDLNFLTENYFKWPDTKKVFEVIPDSLKDNGAIILNDEIELNFPLRNIKRRQSIKILNEQGLNYFRSISLPQNFDITKLNNPVYKQGRFSKRGIPFIREYKISYFAARIIRNKIVYELQTNVKTNKVYWVKSDGERVYDYEYVFNFDDLLVDDIIEYTYKAEINGSYDSDQFYVNDYFPKLKTNVIVSVNYYPENKTENTVVCHNIDSSLYTKTYSATGKYAFYTYNFRFNTLNAIKYSQNCIAGKTLPHITASMYSLHKHYLNSTINNNKFVYSTKYTWFIVPDSLYFKEKIYNKYGASLRKFISKFPENPLDSTNVSFFTQVCDTLNAFKYLSSEQVHYGPDAQYATTSSDKLLKRQLDEEFIEDTYNNILFEKNIFYYKANVQDRRLGFHTTSHRAHEDYELEFFVLPVKAFYKFFVPRFNGMKYLPDELPFYYEGSLCALIPKNTNAIPYKEGLQNIKFIKTPVSTYNENVRIENAVFKVNRDSLLIHSTIKENLNGQFSTILRHFYNNDCIDSTINAYYFKKCIEKPNSSEQKIKLTSFSKTFPFRASYSCTEDIAASKDSIDLSNWFSFILSKKYFQQKITQDYFFDFTFTDTYNFMFEFTKATTISNMAQCNTALSNEFFEISSTLSKQSDEKYLLTVTTKVKQYLLPQQQSAYLLEYVNALDKINSLKLKFSH